MAVRAIILTAGLLAAGCASAPAQVAELAAPHPGEAVYLTNCSACHDQDDEGRTPPKSQLMSLNAAQIRTTLTQGVMKPLAEHLSAAELDQLIGYLTEKP